MSKQQDNKNITNLYGMDTSTLLDLAAEAHKTIYKKEEKKQEDTSENDKNSKSRGQILETLERLAKAEGIKAETREEKYKVPSLRFAEIIDKDYFDMQDVIKEAEDKINEGLPVNKRYTVKLVENIDKKASASDKFYILIEDSNGNYVTMDLLKYQENIYDYTVDEEESIKNVLVKLNGAYTQEIIDVSHRIANYISLALGYKETFYREYKVVGWSRLDGNIIFKYDKIYSNHTPAYKGFCGEDWAEALMVVKEDEENKCLWNTFMAHTFNRSTVASVILCAAVSGIVRQNITFSKENNINMNIVAEKGSGKSTMQHLILSFFGNPDKLEGSFIDTENATDQIRVERAIIPYILDERMLRVESNGEKKKATEMLLSIFREYEGKIKNKLGAQYNNSNANAYGAIISSSVESLLELISKEYAGRDLGQYRRFIEIRASKGDLFADGDHAKAADNLAYSRYGYGVPQLINYIFKLFKYADFVEAISYLCKENINVSDMLYFIDCNMNNKMSEEEKKLLDIRLDVILNQVYEKSEKQKATKVQILDIIKNYKENKDINRTDTLNILYNITNKEISKKLEEFENGIYLDEMDSSAQRFALLILTGHLLNYSLGNSVSELEFNIDIDNMVDYLIGNLYVKLDNADVIVDKQEGEREQQEKEEQKKQEKQEKEKEILQKVIGIYNWIKANESYFYIDGTNIIDEWIGRIEYTPGEMKVVLDKTGGLRLLSAIATLKNSPENMLDYKYRKGDVFLLKDNEVEGLVKTTDLIKVTNEKTFTINKVTKRCYEYTFDVEKIEELQSQEESTDETN